MSSIWEAEQRIREGRRKPTSADKILKSLEVAGNFGLTNVELSHITLSWHRRIGDLRSNHDIETIRLTKGVFRYVLHGSKK